MFANLFVDKEQATNQRGRSEFLAKVDKFPNDGPAVGVHELEVQVHTIDLAEEAVLQIVLETEREKEENGRFFL